MLIAFEPGLAPMENGITVSETVLGWQLSAGGLRPWSFEFSSDQAAEKPDVALLALNRVGQPRLIWGAELFNERAAMAFALSRNDIPPSNPFLAAFAVEADGSSHCFLMQPAPVGADCATETDGRSFVSVFQEHVPGIRAYLQKAIAKRALLGNVAYGDSLAALEAQVDLLTNVVAALAELIPEIQRPALARVLGGVVAQCGVSTLHSNEKLVSDIVAHKVRLRSLQRGYIAAREGNA